MTHFNIAATLATAAWVLWSGAQIVAGTAPWPGANALARPPAAPPAVGASGLTRLSAGPADNTAAAAPACHAADGPAADAPAVPAAHAQAAGWSDT